MRAHLSEPCHNNHARARSNEAERICTIALHCSGVGRSTSSESGRAAHAAPCETSRIVYKGQAFTELGCTHLTQFYHLEHSEVRGSLLKTQDRVRSAPKQP